MDPDKRKCSKCGRILPSSMFYKTDKTKSGFSCWCKDCFSEDAKRYHRQSETNFAFDHIPWPFDNPKCEMDMAAIAEYKLEKQL